MSDRAADYMRHDVDLVFGDGSSPRSHATTYYLWNSLASMRSVAHEFSRDSGLFRKAWILVALAALVEAVSEFTSDFTAMKMGLLPREEFDEGVYVVAMSAVATLASYPLLRTIWPYILRQGTGFSDRSICAASALAIGVSVFLAPLYALTVWFLTAIGLPSLIGDDVAYTQAGEFLILPGLLVGVGIMSFYFSDALDIGPVRAFVFSFLSTLIFFVAVLVPAVVLFLHLTGDLIDLTNFAELFREAPFREE